MNFHAKQYILTLSCVDNFGIVAAVTGALAQLMGFIVESSQFGDASSNRFFMRTVFFVKDDGLSQTDIEERFRPIAERFAMQWSIHPKDQRLKALVLVSKLGHCLNDLLHRTSSRKLPVDIVSVASNHPDLEDMARSHKVPFHYLPVNDENRATQEANILKLASDHKVDLVILARYMQILSNDLCKQLEGRAINIHHSFLPSFKGAKPYHQAFHRGVKLIGATAHYVTSDLDEGPIIEQETMRVHHAFDADELAQIGHDVETMVLARAIQLHADRRVLVNNSKTVVFR